MKPACFVCLFAILITTMGLAQSSPVPLINQPLVPASVAPGGNGFALTVDGTGFVSKSVVKWNGSPLATSFVSSSQLVATIPASYIAQPNTATVTVTNPAPGGGTSNPIFFTTTNPTPSTTLGTSTLTAGKNPSFVAVGDLNNDGNLDLVVANSGANTISVLLGNGDGTFQSQRTFTAGKDSVFKIAIGDLNKDGHSDIVVTHSSSTTVSVLLGNGDGSFQPAVDYQVGSQPFTPILAD